MALSLPQIIPQSSTAVGAAGEAYAEDGFLTPPTKTGNPVMDAGGHPGVSASEAFVNGSVDAGKGVGAMPSRTGGTLDKRDALSRSFTVSDSSSSSVNNSSGSMESSSVNSGDARIFSEEKVEEGDKQQQQQYQRQGTLDSLGVDSVGVRHVLQ